jgi:cyanamide hydratase
MQVGNWQPVPRDQEVLFKDIKFDVKPYTTSDFPPPTTELAKAVQEFAKSHLNAKTFNHSNRIFYFGLAIIKATFPEWEIDEETWYCTCLLHDIGLAEEFHLTTKMSFEVSHLVPRCRQAEMVL